ncbi:hypothetical protein L596_012336 [Steinernema carpocapsae]|uniref:Uncharacterized protein n=1 Tax=Steinernema carpocapsae TaxID=34508 RepID=A0A4V6A4U4_STECR|nr:hypothetical protein L596_012336 [Steinernema carpocapsae]
MRQQLPSWITQISLLGLLMAFFIAEFIIAVLLFFGTLFSSLVFAKNFSDFFFTFGGLVLGVDIAVFTINVFLTGAAAAFDMVKLPCFMHAMISGLIIDTIYTARIAFAIVSGTWFYGTPPEKISDLRPWMLLMSGVACFLFAVHVLFLVRVLHFKSEISDQGNWKNRVFKEKDF